MDRRTFTASLAVLVPATAMAQNAPQTARERIAPVKLIISFTPKEEFRAEFEKLMISVRGTLPTVPGCVGVDVLKALEGELRFTLVETWETRQRHQTHIDGVVRSGDWARIAAMLKEEPKGIYYSAL